MNSAAQAEITHTKQELALIGSVVAWALACLAMRGGLSWLLHQPRLYPLLGGTGFQDAEFRWFTVATLCCLAGWSWLSWKRFRWGKEHRGFVVAWAILAIAWLGFVREVHPQGWDFMTFHLAGRGIVAGINIYDPSDVASFNAGYDYGITYFTYPPFVAAVLGQLRSLSTDEVFLLSSMLNYFALLFCGACMYLLLVRYGIPRTAGALGVLASLLVNVAVTRTLMNSQVNLWVLAFILVAVLFHRSIPMLSAFSLALATMLRVTPILIAGLFVLRCERKWLLFFVLSLSVLLLGTVALHPFDYWIEYVRFALRLGVLVEPTHMRDNSFDALIVHTFQVLGIKMLELRKWLVLALKVGFGAWVTKLIVSVVRRGTFVAKGNEDAFALNGLPLFMVMMTMARPMVWPHHFVFLALPVLVTLAAAREPRTLGLLLLAYASLFLIPVFDLYPLSLHRLAAVILYVYCVGLVTKQDIVKPTAIERLAGVLSAERGGLC